MMALTPSDCRRLKLLLILETAGEAVLRYTLLCGTDGKPDDVPLDEYLKNLPQSSTSNFNKMIEEHVRRHPASSSEMPKVYSNHINKQFNKTDLSQITSDPSCGAFDITLLHKAIRVACENVAKLNHQKWKTRSSEMEYLVTEIKDLRNKVVHEKHALSELEYLDKVMEVEDLFSRALESTKLRYNRKDSELSEKKAKVRRAVEAVMKEHMGRKEILRRSVSQLLPNIKKETNEEIRVRLDSAKYLNPLYFLSGSEDTKVDVNNIFSKIIINEERSVKKTIDHQKIMTQTQEGRSPASPHLMLIEGDAGSGKTTFLKFLLSDWLKEEPNRCMDGLQHFDLLLWVVCRQESSCTLENLLAKYLPDAFIRYRDLLLPLLKKCKILFAVDGLDEETESSRRLLTDILSQGKDCPTFTVVCTSRPEGLMGMKARTPQNFQISHMRIEGISVEERPKFVERHVDHLSKCSGLSVDNDRLRKALQHIGWRELFRLPLNLLFLSYMYIDEPQKLTSRITQTELYQNISDWSVDKLYHRVSGRHQDILLKRSILNTMRVVYEVSLRELLRGSIYLGEKSLAFVISSCKTEGLPERELLSAFFCLRRELVDGKHIEKYCAPHKGLQEFLAAQYIIGRLDKYKSGDIRRVLQGYTEGQALELRLLRNLFCQLLGILSRQKEPKLTATEEAVDLIHESGVKKTEDWLTVLADTEAHHHAMTRTAHHIRQRSKGFKRKVISRIFPSSDRSLKQIMEDNAIVEVRDGTLHVAAVLLPLIPFKILNIKVEMDSTGLEELLFPAITNHCVNGLSLVHHFEHPHAHAVSGRLLEQCPRILMREFRGHLHAKLLPLLPDVQHAFLAVGEPEEARLLLSTLKHVREHCPRLKYLCVHVPVSSVIASSLAPLPHVADVHLILSGVGDGQLEAACSIAAAMCPEKKGYESIRFLGDSLSVGEYRRLLEGLAAAGVKLVKDDLFPGVVVVPDTTAVTRAEMEELRTLAQSLLECGFLRWRKDELWQMWRLGG